MPGATGPRFRWLRERGQDDGTGGGLQCASSCRASGAECTRGVDITHHDSERFAIAMFAGAESLDGGGIRCVDAQVKTPDAFDGRDFTGEEALDRCGNGIVGTEWMSRPGIPSQTRGPQSRQALGWA